MNAEMRFTSEFRGCGVLGRVFLVILALAAVGAAWADEQPSAGNPAVPATLERVTPSRAVAYGLFFVLAGLVLLLVHRGIRAR